MPYLVHHLLLQSATLAPNNIALIHKTQTWTYQELNDTVIQYAHALFSLSIKPKQRVAVFLPKQIETVSSFFAISLIGAVVVPINPVLKPLQVAHIIEDCTVSVLITSKSRYQQLALILESCPELHTIILVDDIPAIESNKQLLNWQTFLNRATHCVLPQIIDTDMAAILYTSGSTGKPKGVVLSHRNLVTGAKSVSDYLTITDKDRLLAVLPFSFDYGLNQLLSAFLNQACCVLLDYLLPKDVLNALGRYQITGLAAVPPLWTQLAKLDWSNTINLRYITNSGGKLPKAILNILKERLPNTQIFLMYGLTEAFRSTYLPLDQLDKRPDSIGKAIPNAEILVVRNDGSLCEPYESGELVHKGSLVALGYWNDAEKTAERFKPAPQQHPALPLTEMAVWSGDTVMQDEDGYLYFVGRSDDMIKTSGYRVSPTEIEEVVYASGLIKEAAAIGVADDTLGQLIVLVIAIHDDYNEAKLVKHCQTRLPNFMQPVKIVVLEQLPKNPNGKIDRAALSLHFSEVFSS